MSDQSNIDAVVRKIRALLETKGCSEAEAEARMRKAQELLEKHNLEMASIDGKPNSGAIRKDQKLAGGLYSWQRRLWNAVSELNFCVYFSIKGLQRGSQYEHRVVGSHANVVATEVMARYLQETIEKLAQEWAKANFYKSVFVREAIAYREGMAGRIAERLADRRAQQISEARQAKARQDAENARDGISPTTTALTIVDIVSSETDFNNDYLNGWEMGTTAKNRHESDLWYKNFKAKEDAKRAARDADELLHPEKKAARLAAEEQQMKEWLERQAKEQKRRDRTPPKPRYRRETPEEQRANLGSYWEGRAKGSDVGLDQQVNTDNTRRIK